MKRLFDLLITFIGLIAIAPLLLLITLLIRLDSPGPIFFRQKRAGKNGVLFDVYKFRTMIENAESMGPTITAKNDARITQIGQILRWLKLDELPQLFNVLKGDMSLVGPRPEVPKIVELYTQEQRKVLDVKPGIIGPSQIKLRDEASLLPDKGDVESFYVEKILPGKLETDLAYITDPAPFKDIKILIGGLLALFLSSIKFRYILESKRRISFLIFDIFISVLSYFLAFNLRYESTIPPSELELFRDLLPLIIIFRAPYFIYFGLYQTLWQYLGMQELIAIIRAVSMGSLTIPLFSFLFHVQFPPRSVMIMDWFLLITSLGGSRILFKMTAEKLRRPYLGGLKKNALIIGAEDAGELLIREFIKRPSLGYRPIGFLDDAPDKQGVRIHGVKVLGKISQLTQIARLKKTEEVIIALSHISGNRVKEIIQVCRELRLPCRILPQTSTFLAPQTLPLKLRNVEVSDLLGRELIEADIPGIQQLITGKKLLITGAGGSIGSELTKIIHQNHPDQLILVDNSENNLYDIQMELNRKLSHIETFFYLRDIRDPKEMEEIFERHRPDIVYHASAYKHVPMMEHHPIQGILNNVMGTKNVADLSMKYRTQRFVLISTDKAIRPRSLMGATKRVAELYIQSLGSSPTQFFAVRFGNVFNSKGSVVPLFKKQIEEGGPVTVTDPDVTRYFIDISEAVYLILQATILGHDSEIFLLDMGKPVKIVDLAKNLAQLMGVNPETLPITYTGLRPGEKLEEEIQSENEKAIPTAHKKIKIWRSNQKPPQELGDLVRKLIDAAQNKAHREDIVALLRNIVPEYYPWDNF